MSETTAPRLDPRFDPRFQRGYVPDAAALAAESTAPAPAAAEPVPAAVSQRVPAARPTPSSRRPDASIAEPAGLASEVLEPPARDETIRPVDDGVPRHAPSEPSASDSEPAFAALFEPPRDDESSRFASWFIAGWGLSVVAAVIGVALWSAAVASENYYYGPRNDSDRWLQLLGWSVAPSLIEAGLLGVVGMLVWTGLRHAHRHEEEP